MFELFEFSCYTLEAAVIFLDVIFQYLWYILLFPFRRQVAENGLELVVKMAHDARGDCELAQICTGILESLFKTSEDTCSRVIKLGGLDTITYWCRCNDRVTLKNCAIALSNLALYGGGENQQEMAKHKVPEWLFPLAFVDDDSVRYYALLAIGVLVSNKEIENAVTSSGTLALVLPFIDSHDPAEFAERDTSHRHGRSPGWLKRLIPVLSSKREEAQALAAFHFVMEAGIKSEQGRKEVRIGTLLRKILFLKFAIAQKFKKLPCFSC